MKFNLEEIKLFQKIKKLHDKVFPWAYGEDKPGQIGELVWLGEISDCIFWLHEQGYEVKLKVSEFSSIILHHLESRSSSSDYESYYNNSPLEACLKAVLAVLEEKGEK